MFAEAAASSSRSGATSTQNLKNWPKFCGRFSTHAWPPQTVPGQRAASRRSWRMWRLFRWKRRSRRAIGHQMPAHPGVRAQFRHRGRLRRTQKYALPSALSLLPLYRHKIGAVPFNDVPNTSHTAWSSTVSRHGPRQGRAGRPYGSNATGAPQFRFCICAWSRILRESDLDGLGFFVHRPAPRPSLRSAHAVTVKTVPGYLNFGN